MPGEGLKSKMSKVAWKMWSDVMGEGGGAGWRGGEREVQTQLCSFGIFVAIRIYRRVYVRMCVYFCIYVRI